MVKQIDIECLPQFKQLYHLSPDTNLVICIGGRGGSKTYEVSKFIAYSATIKKKRCAVLRDEKSTIRESILNEILLRYDTANEYGAFNRLFDRNETGIKDKSTGNSLVFTKGFKASSNQKTAGLKSISDVDIAIIEEAEDIRSEDKFNTFADSIRNAGSLIIIVLNTPDINHFLIKRYFNLSQPEQPKGWTQKDVEGFFEITPKNIPGFVCIMTGYEDNPFLPEHVVNRYKSYGDPESHLYNPFYYKTAIKGWASTGRKGQILTKVKPIKLKDYMALPFKEIYGQDFGTASPAGFVGVKFDKNNCYCRQINYLPMDTLSIAKMYCRMKLTKDDKIIADSAEPHTINRLKVGWKPNELPAEEFRLYPALAKGFYMIPAVKGVGSIEFGIGLMTSLNLFAVEESTDLWNEIYNWVYDVDKNGVTTDEPIDDYNHLIDPWRYVVGNYKGQQKSNIRGQLGRLI